MRRYTPAAVVVPKLYNSSRVIYGRAQSVHGMKTKTVLVISN